MIKLEDVPIGQVFKDAICGCLLRRGPLVDVYPRGQHISAEIVEACTVCAPILPGGHSEALRTEYHRPSLEVHYDPLASELERQFG